MKMVIVITTSILLLLFILLFVFIRSSIEVGEERIWLLFYLAAVPPMLALFIVWGLDKYPLLMRLVVGLLTASVVALLFVKAPRFADEVYENPARFRLFLPIILCAERFYFASVPVDQERHERHKEKERRWQDFLGDRRS